MSLDLGVLLVYALFFYVVIYFAVKNAIVAAHTTMEENKKNSDAEAKADQEQEKASKVSSVGDWDYNANDHSSSDTSENNGLGENNNMDEYNH